MIIRFSKVGLLIPVLLLGGCATVSVADLSQPGFGYHKFAHFDGSENPDPMNVANGLYTPRAFQDHSAQAQLNLGSWNP